MESRVGHGRKPFLCHFEDRFAFELPYGHIILRKEIVFSLVLSKLKHRCIFEFHIIKKLMIAHKENLHELVEVAVEDPLRV